MRLRLLLAGLVALGALHQDFWLWQDGRLLAGFVPSGLAYHAAYSLATAAFWLAAVRHAWPAHLDAEAKTDGSSGGRDE